MIVEDRRRRLYFATVMMAGAFVIGIVGFYLLGGGAWSLLDCAYMTAITLSTVGYGEALPISNVPGGKVFTIILVFGGVATVLYFASTIMAFLVEGDLQALLGSKRMEKRTRKMHDHFIVCGVGRTGRHTVRQLIRAGHEVVLVDQSEARIQDFLDRDGVKLLYIAGDAADEATLQNAGIDRARGLICALDSDQANLYAVLTARERNRSLRIVSKVSGRAAAKKFKLVGADAVVAPNELGGKRLFSEMTQPAAVAFLEQLVLPDRLNLAVQEIVVSESSVLAGQTLAKADLRREVGNVLILAIKLPDQQEYEYSPKPDSRLMPGASVMAMGAPDEIDRLRTLAS
ncbi:MAG: potassium channel protein [bacterium]